ncbi:epimerase [Streptomyces aureus]|uniref:Epimerase n=1 Tax=Streptomyces aureus TaxID=193461 RepID=A0ABV4SM54_9ACTN
MAHFAGRATILRPGVILGPGEYVGRLPWWLSRCERGGTILAPGRPGQQIQPADVRDVAEFALTAPPGTYNVAAPRGRDTMSDLLAACLHVTGNGGHFAWAGDDLLKRHGVREWTELPLWRATKGTWAVDSARAQKAGLQCRPLADTVVDTWAWLEAGDGPVAHPRWDDHGISPAKEQELLHFLQS